MGLRDLIDRILSKDAKPAEPAPSIFGPEADRRMEEKARADEFELEVEKLKGWPRGL